MPQDWSLWALILALVLAALVIAVAGTRLSKLSDQIADRSGMGEAITGTLFLGIVTSLSGISASITAAADGRAALAISNAIGGIAIQTAFLAIADITYTKANLEHAAASITNMIQTALLVMLLTLVLMGLSGPDLSLAHVHPITPLLLVAAGAGFWLAINSTREPMWQPKRTLQTVQDVPNPGERGRSLTPLLAGFFLTAAIVVVAGSFVAQVAGGIADQTGISETVAGGIFSGPITSLPELVTTIAAVRQGALTLAVSDIVGGNAFDVLFVFVADLVYTGGSIYHAPGVGRQTAFLTGLAILLAVVLLIGLLYRQNRGPGNIGFESALILALYVAGFLTVALLM